MVDGLALRVDVPRAPAPLPEEEEEFVVKGKITCEQLLLDLLAQGPVSLADVHHRTARAGFAWATVMMARRQLNVRTAAGGIWELTPEEEDGNEELAASQRGLC
jgi:hypothetical protein